MGMKKKTTTTQEQQKMLVTQPFLGHPLPPTETALDLENKRQRHLHTITSKLRFS